LLALSNRCELLAVRVKPDEAVASAKAPTVLEHQYPVLGHRKSSIRDSNVLPHVFGNGLAIPDESKPTNIEGLREKRVPTKI